MYLKLKNDLQHTGKTKLLRSFQAGEEGAFALVYEKYYAPLINFARKKTNNIQVAEDMVQDIFVHLYLHREVESNMEGYLYTALRRKIYNYWRHEMVKSNYQAYIEYKNESARESNVSEIVELKELEEELEKQIGMLPPQCRKIFRLKKEKHCSNNDIAEMLGISVKTVEAHMTKALKILRAHFDYYSFIGLLLTIYGAIG